ncbi:MAG: Gfo/Idh/MocA family protein [Candidatus Sumerlaeaceae bacterium]
MAAISKIRMGMVGGGDGAFIGAVHRMAAALAGNIELVCGAFSSIPERSLASAQSLGIASDRAYATYRQMFEVEAMLPEGERMDFVSIVTPNHLHYEVARAAIETGFHVLCEKPLTTTLEQALTLEECVRRQGVLFAVAFNYTAYPLVKHARELVMSGALGQTRKVIVEYVQGWLAFPIEREGQKQALWRTDPAIAGPAGCLGDIGTHAANLAEYITAQPIAEVCAELTSFVEGRRVDDDAAVLLRFANGARGLLHASQVAIDEENGLCIRVYGTKGGLEWHQEEPNTLILKWADRAREIIRAGTSYGTRLSPSALAACRLPAGHPEGFLEAFANLYRNFADAVRSRRGDIVEPAFDYPTLKDGLRAMAFVDAVLRSARTQHKWTPVSYTG